MSEIALKDHVVARVGERAPADLMPVTSSVDHDAVRSHVALPMHSTLSGAADADARWLRFVGFTRWLGLAGPMVSRGNLISLVLLALMGRRL